MGGNYSSQHTLAREGKTEELKKLQKSKTLKINAKDHLGWTCLHWAAHFNRVETVHWLLQNGADINSRNANAFTPLLSASINGRYDVIKVLLEFHADINVFNDRGEYGIHLAFNAQTVRLFHELGVDVNLRSVTDAGPNITPLHYACTMARGSVVATLIELGADANAPDYYGVRPLEIVVKLRDDEMNRSILKMLLEAGADPCECISGSHLETYLHYVASRGKQNFACMLIEHGADINAMDLRKETPLQKVNGDEMRCLMQAAIDALDNGPLLK